MLRRACGLALLALAGLGLPAGAQTTLEWKFKEGDKFYVEDVSDMKQALSVIGKDINQKTKITTVNSYTVKQVSGKTVRLEQKTESVDVSSSGDGVGGQLEKIMEKLQGAVFTVTLTEGKVTKFEGYDDFIKKVSDGDELAAKFGKTLLSEDLMKKTIELTFGNLPDKAVKAGDTWSKDALIPFGELGDFKSSNNYTFKERDKDGVVLTYKGTMTYLPPKGPGAFGGLLKIVKGKMKSDNVAGTLVFDADKGRLVRATSTMAVRGSLTVEIMGNQIEMDIRVDQSTKTRVLTKNPKSD